MSWWVDRRHRMHRVQPAGPPPRPCAHQAEFRSRLIAPQIGLGQSRSWGATSERVPVWRAERAHARFTRCPPWTPATPLSWACAFRPVALRPRLSTGLPFLTSASVGGSRQRSNGKCQKRQAAQENAARAAVGSWRGTSRSVVDGSLNSPSLAGNCRNLRRA